jgi:PST family polysaccharide transporter
MVEEDGRQFSTPDEVENTVSQPLGGVVRRGVLLSGIAFGLVQLVSLVGTVALARLLTPTDVGIYAAATVLSVALISLSEGSLRLALIQRAGDVEAAANTVFWATAVSGLVVSAFTIAAAPILGYIFGNDLVVLVALATSGLLFLESLAAVPDGLMQRRFNFLRRLVVEPSRAITYAIAAVAFAASGFGVWSMVLGQYASTIVWLIGSWSMARWRPGHARPSLRLWRELVGFSHPIVIWDMMLYARETAQTAIIGRVLGPAALGNYRYGSRIGTLPGLAVFEIGSSVLFPAFSRIASDPQRLRAAFLRALRWIWFAAAPIAAVVVALGEQTVVVVFGERWHDAGYVVVALAGYGLGRALQAAPTEAIMAVGRSSLFHWISGLGLVLGIGLVIALLPWGVFGVGIAISLAEVITGIVLLVLAKPIVGYRLGTVVRTLVPPTVAASAALVAVVVLQRVTTPLDQLPTANAIGAVVAQFAAFLTCYLVGMTVLDHRLVFRAITKLGRRLWL